MLILQKHFNNFPSFYWFSPGKNCIRTAF